MTVMGSGDRGGAFADVPILPAATLVLVRAGERPEILLVKRSGKQVFMPDLWVFPGGRVDEADHADVACDPFRVAAVRECFEEAAIQLPSCGAEALPEIACWVTPIGEKRRFHTRFFVAITAPEAHGPERPDDHEVVDARWHTAEDARKLHRAGALPLAPPTWCTLRALEPFTTIDAILAWARATEAAGVEPIRPTLGTHRGRPAVFWDGGALWLEHHATGPAWSPVPAAESD
jgi:8-oxo-dGTP pyrophosphatase MutT (NUDIX family)